MRGGAILFNDAEPFGQTVNTHSTENPMYALMKIGQSVLEEFEQT